MNTSKRLQDRLLGEGRHDQDINVSVKIELTNDEARILGNILTDVIYGNGPSKNKDEKNVAKKLADIIRTKL